MLETELKHLLSAKRGIPHPSCGHPLLFYNATSLAKGTDYHWDGMKRELTPAHPQVLFQYTFSGYGSFKKGRKTFRLEKGQAFFAVIPSHHVYELPSQSPGWSFFYLTFQHPYLAERISRALKEHSGVLSLNEQHPLIVKSAELIRLGQTGMFLDRLDEESHLLDWMCCAERNLNRDDKSRKETGDWQARAVMLLDRSPGTLPPR